MIVLVSAIYFWPSNNTSTIFSHMDKQCKDITYGYLDNMDFEDPSIDIRIILWETDRLLEGYEFAGMPTDDNKIDMCTFTWIRIPWDVALDADSSEPQFHFKYIKAEAYFRTYDSWVNPSVFELEAEIQNKKLKHEQGHFDLAEEYARKAETIYSNQLLEKEFPTNGATKKEQLINAKKSAKIMVDKIWEEIQNEWNFEDEQYEKKTDRMWNFEIQKEYDFRFEKLRKLPSPDPNSNQINIITKTPVKYENVPWEHIRLNPLKLVGDETDPLYRSYGFPEEDFRFVCEEPCFDYIDEEMIIAEYWEFKNVHGPLLDFMGNANMHHSTLPLDFHLNDDSVCNDYDIVVPGYSHRYIEDINGKSVGGRAYICLYYVELGYWFNDKQVTSNYYLSDIEGSTAHQQLAIHEYSHPILSRLLTPNFYVVEEDIAKVASFYVGEQEFLRTDENNNNFLQKVTDPCDPLLDREWSSKTIYELCQQNGLTFDDFTLSMSRLKDLKEQQGSTTYYDWYLILNDILGSDTRQAFLDSTLPEDFLEP